VPFVQLADSPVGLFVDSVIQGVRFFAAEKDAAAQWAILAGQTSRTLLVWASVACEPRGIRRLGSPQQRKFAQGRIQAMVKQIESAAGSASHADRLTLSVCSIDIFVDIEYGLQERGGLLALPDRRREVSRVGGMMIILGWRHGESLFRPGCAISPG
jgi:hypothetical protein